MQENVSKKCGIKKIIFIMSLTVLGAMIGLGMSFLPKQQWKAEVHLIRPTTVELGNYYSLFSMYQLVTQDKGMSPIDIAYQEFRRQASSYDTKRNFWLSNAYYKQQISGNELKDNELLRQLIQQTYFYFGDEISYTPDRVELHLENPKRASELVAEFVAYVNTTTRQVLYGDLILQWQTRFNQVNTATQLGLKDGQDWIGRLNMMKSVTALDNKFIGYRYSKQPALPTEMTINRIIWSLFGAGIGFLLSLGRFCFFRKK